MDAPQECLRELMEPMQKAGTRAFLIGGAQAAGELDAKRAIDQGTRLAAVIEDTKGGEVFEQVHCVVGTTTSRVVNTTYTHALLLHHPNPVQPLPQSYKVMQFIQSYIGKGK
jgi:hypothetical protein